MRLIHWLYVVSAALFIGGIAFIIAGARTAQLAAPVEARAPEITPVASVKQLMDGIVGAGRDCCLRLCRHDRRCHRHPRKAAVDRRRMGGRRRERRGARRVRQPAHGGRPRGRSGGLGHDVEGARRCGHAGAQGDTGEGPDGQFSRQARRSTPRATTAISDISASETVEWVDNITEMHMHNGGCGALAVIVACWCSAPRQRRRSARRLGQGRRVPAGTSGAGHSAR